MTIPFRNQFLTMSLVFLFGCTGSRDKDEGSHDPHAELVQACVHNCLKPLCTTTVTFGPEYESECESQCEERATLARDNNCLDEYEALLACTEEASCETYYLWYEQEPGAPCTDLESDLVNLCPAIDLRDGD